MASDAALLAIDAGGSYVKAVIFEPPTGRTRSAGRPVPIVHPRPGWNERDLEELWRLAVECVRELLSDEPGLAARIAGIGITGHGNGVYLLDAEGRQTRRAILAADGRASEIVRRWRADGLEDELRPITWNGLWAGKPAAILAWVKENEPEVVAATRAVVGCKDFLRSRLTGAIDTELTDATAGGLYDAPVLLDDPEASIGPSATTLGALGIEEWAHALRPTIPSMRMSAVCGPAAEETGLVAGTPVVAGVVDNAAMQHGSGIFDSSALCVGAGTWSINQLLVPLAEMTAEGALGAVKPMAANSALNRMGLLSEASATSASSYAWALKHAVTGQAARDEASGANIYDAALERISARGRRADDPLYIPFIDGSRDEAAARGAWLGLSSSTDETALLGAVVEGICFEHRRHVERLELAYSQTLPIRLSGGITKSDDFNRCFADILGRPIEVSATSELGAVCVAAMAGVGAGLLPSLGEGVAVLNPSWTTWEPSGADADVIGERWARYAKWAGVLENERWGE